MPDWTAAEDAMERAILRHYPFILNAGAADVGADLGREIALDPAQTAKVMDQIGVRVKGIVDTQKERLAILVNTYQGDPAVLRVQIQEAIDTSELRAGVIAKSEITHAFNSGVALACQSAGVKVQIADGDEDEPCKSVNGTIQEAEWLLANPSGHPNCSRRGFAVPA